MMSTRLIREPLFHFFVIGALLFALFISLNPVAMQSAEEISVDKAQIAGLSSQFERLWLRPPTSTELQGLVDAWIREEVLYREGMAMGLDRGDTIIRRRIAQKMMIFADSLSQGEPTDEQLQAWLDRDPERYRSPAVYTLQQVYFELHGANLDVNETVSTALRLLQDDDQHAADIGDSILLPPALEDTSEFEIARMFGEEFTEALESLPVGEWAGPIRSGYGAHLVKVDARIPAQAATLAEVRDAVERDFLSQQSTDLGETFYEVLKSRYTIQVEVESQIGTSDEAL